MSGDGNYGDIDEHEAIATINAALDMGVVSIDCAPGYGHGYAESLLGRALSGRRNEAIITTKFGVQPGRGRDSSPVSIRDEIDQSLMRLQTSYVDYYVGHWPDKGTPLSDTVQQLEKLKQAGKIRAFGFSNYTLDMVRECETYGSVDVVQVGYSLFDRRMEDTLIRHCQEEDIPLMTYGPLAHGLLIDEIATNTVYSPKDWRTKGYAIGQSLFTADNFQKNVGVSNRLRDQVARPKGMTVSQLAISWVLSNPAVTTVLVGARNRRELSEDLGGIRPLQPNELEQIAAIMADAAGQVAAFYPFRKGHEDWSV